jgi:hypothetical protein
MTFIINIVAVVTIATKTMPTTIEMIIFFLFAICYIPLPFFNLTTYILSYNLNIMIA